MSNSYLESGLNVRLTYLLAHQRILEFVMHGGP
jgi:hypothetical protein